MNFRWAVIWILGLCLPLLAMDISVNKSIHVGDHEKSGGCTTVNGSVHVGDNSKITGGCRTVNGSVNIGRECSIKSVHTVNGYIKIDKGTRVRGTLASVNGYVTCKHGCSISGDIETVNGSITLHDTEVDNDLTTYNGDIKLLNGTIVHKDVIVKKNKGQNNRKKPLYIVIDNNSVVKGNVINLDNDIKVVVQLHDGGKIKGRTKNVVIEKD